MKSWKTSELRDGERVFILLQWSHDGEVVEDRGSSGAARSRRGHFNGATTVKSWKTIDIDDREINARLLQWSHDGEVVEDLAEREHNRKLTDQLQWSHDGEVVEDACPRVRAGFHQKLQWSHDGEVVEDSWRRLANANAGRTSMEPRR